MMKSLEERKDTPKDPLYKALFRQIDNNIKRKIGQLKKREKAKGI